MNADPELLAFAAEVEEEILDIAESKLIFAIKAGEGWAVRFLTLQGSGSRVWVEDRGQRAERAGRSRSSLTCPR